MFYQEVTHTNKRITQGNGFIFANTLKELTQVREEYNKDAHKKIIPSDKPKILTNGINIEFGILNYIKTPHWSFSCTKAWMNKRNIK
jgi:hypothetical protein